LFNRSPFYWLTKDVSDYTEKVAYDTTICFEKCHRVIDKFVCVLSIGTNGVRRLTGAFVTSSTLPENGDRMIDGAWR